MLDTQRDRVDYGEQLMPPVGYELDAAIATTYTLDLSALLTVPVAMCLRNTLDGDIAGERIALLEAMGQLKGRLKVFYQGGMIKLPPEYNRLYTLLEPCLQAVTPPGGINSSFHPKMWLLRFVTSEKPRGRKKTSDIAYRLLVLSRNLTFDRSWDVAVSLDGELGNNGVSGENRWASFVKELLKGQDSEEPWKSLLAELPKVVWHPPANFEQNIKLLPGGPALGKPLELGDDLNEILVISPFIKDTGNQKRALDWLAGHCPNGKRWLLSRSEELDAIGKANLEDWHCFAINEHVVDGEENLELEDGMEQNLHAKLIVTRHGSNSTWHIGSANATSAALGDENHPPRNSELMLRLTGHVDKCGLQRLLEHLISDEGEGLFVEHEFQERVESDEAETDATLRTLAYILANTAWKLQGELSEDGTIMLSLSSATPPAIPVGYAVQVGQLAVRNAYRPLVDHTVTWGGLNITQVSALLPFRILRENEVGEAELLDTLVIQVQLSLPEGIDREKQIISEMLNSEEKFLSYVKMLLQSDPDKNQWLGYDNSESGADIINYFLTDEPIFEQLMRAAAHDPAALARIDRLIDRIKGTEVPIPPTFQKLWEVFRRVKE
ncbi:MAG: phospholipase D family protein [Ktedonobacteraceae bacterium]